MTTSPTAPLVRPTGPEAVTTVGRLLDEGLTHGELRAQFLAGRWRRFGHAVVRHNGPLSERQRRAVALVNAGPRSLLTAFTSLELLGLQHWHRDDVHVLVPAGARVRRVPAITVSTHAVVEWPPPIARGHPELHHPAHAAVLAASGVKRPRVGIALLAACVQQGLVTARLVEPVRQAVRVEPSGRRRYLDVEWTRPDGTAVVAEVDGGLHLRPENWWDDQFRQNEVTLGRSVVLRFPSVAVREPDPRIVDQLRRAGVPGLARSSTAARTSL